MLKKPLSACLLSAEQLQPQFPTFTNDVQLAQHKETSWSPLSLHPELQQATTWFLQNPWYKLLCIEAEEPEMIYPLLRLVAEQLQIAPRIYHSKTSTCVELFGQYSASSTGSALWKPGALLLEKPEIVLLPLRWLRSEDRLISLLWRTIESGWFTAPHSATVGPVNAQDPVPLPLRMIVVGNSEEIASLENQWHGFDARYLFTSIRNYFFLQERATLLPWIRWIAYLLEEHRLPAVSSKAWKCILQAAIAHTEDHTRLPLTLNWLQKLLLQAATNHPQQPLASSAITEVLQRAPQASAVLQEETLQDILLDQVHIDTEGEAIGQANGLAVFGRPGDPYVAGTPMRITCASFVGESTISDIENKVSLGGSIHTKGILILEAYLSLSLQLPYPLPIAASIVFEQSYGEIDGDSATLATGCALLSSLAELPLSQAIALTGALDQQGYVLPVGGLNEKITCFFDLCNQRGLTKQQGVILPHRNRLQLQLPERVGHAVEKGTFHLWTIEHLSQAIPLLSSKSDNEPLTHEGVLQRIRARAEAIHHYEPTRKGKGWFARLLP